MTGSALGCSGVWSGLTDGGDEGGVEGVFTEPEQQACFTDTTVADQQQFEQVVVRLGHLPVSWLGSPGTFTEPPSPAHGLQAADTQLETPAGLRALVPSTGPSGNRKQSRQVAHNTLRLFSGASVS